MKKAKSSVASRQTPARLAKLYEADEVAWLEKSARLIRQKKFAGLDYDHLAEYLHDMAKRDRREVKSRLIALLVHLLKWQFQPNMRTGSWKATVLYQRVELEDICSSKTLKNHAFAISQEAYRNAVKVASTETGLPVGSFPDECPYTLEFVLGEQFPGSDEPA